MARPRKATSTREPQKLGEGGAVTVSLRVDLETMLRMEQLLHLRMVEALETRGERSAETASTLIREALREYLDRYKAPSIPRKRKK